jgi:NTP pyrophosphatase (non-canonical NTP hydrolase)
MPDILDIDKIKQTLEDFAAVRDWNQFHHPKNLVMSLACETGELLEIFQWMSEAESVDAARQPKIKTKTSEELADIMLNLIRLAALMDIHLAEAIERKIVINNQKYPAELVKGSAKKYTEYEEIVVDDK